MNDASDELLVKYEEYVKNARDYIRKNWRHLPERTRVALTNAGYGERGQYIGDERSVDDAVDGLEQNLGRILKINSATLPSKADDKIIVELRDTTVTFCAQEILSDPRWNIEPFIVPAIHALIKQRIADNFALWVFLGGKPGTPPASESLFAIISGLVYSVGIPFGIGYGLTFAVEGNALYASGCALYTYFAFGYILNLGKDHGGLGKEYEQAYGEYTKLYRYQEPEIGRGHGLEIKLTEMLRKGVHVPTVLFDLVAELKSVRRHFDRG